MSAANKFAVFFDTTIDEATECHHLTLQLMDEYAKERAIAFAEWCDDFGYRQNANGVWCKIDNLKYVSTAELYDIFNNENQEK